jgi:hypothetical protein
LFPTAEKIYERTPFNNFSILISRSAGSKVWDPVSPYLNLAKEINPLSNFCSSP